MTNYNKLTKTQLIEMLNEAKTDLKNKQYYYVKLEEQLRDFQETYQSLKKSFDSLKQHATKQNTEIKELKAQPQQAYTLIINNTNQYDFTSKDACHTWMKATLYSYKLLTTIETPTCKVVFIMAVSKAKHNKTK